MSRITHCLAQAFNKCRVIQNVFSPRGYLQQNLQRSGSDIRSNSAWRNTVPLLRHIIEWKSSTVCRLHQGIDEFRKRQVQTLSYVNRTFFHHCAFSSHGRCYRTNQVSICETSDWLIARARARLRMRLRQSMFRFSLKRNQVRAYVKQYMTAL